MDIQKEREALIAEIEVFKAEMLKSYVIKAWAESYTNTDPFSYVFTNDGNNEIWWMKTQAHQLWEMWQAAKARAVQNPHYETVVKSIIEHVDSHLSNHVDADLFDKGWTAAMKCIRHNIARLEEMQEKSNV